MPSPSKPDSSLSPLHFKVNILLRNYPLDVSIDGFQVFWEDLALCQKPTLQSLAQDGKGDGITFLIWWHHLIHFLMQLGTGEGSTPIDLGLTQIFAYLPNGEKGILFNQ